MPYAAYINYILSLPVMFSTGLCIITAKCNEIEKEKRMDFWEIFQFLKCNVNWELFLGQHRKCGTQCHQYKWVQPRCSLPGDDPRSLQLESPKTSLLLLAKPREGHGRMALDELLTALTDKKRGWSSHSSGRSHGRRRLPPQPQLPPVSKAPAPE